MRGRGSKLLQSATQSAPRGRPPCGGVDRNKWECGLAVRDWRSPPMRGRGSKPCLGALLGLACRRPPCGGVDRNSAHCAPMMRPRMSPPMRGRGSKLRGDIVKPGEQGRPPCGGVDRNRIRQKPHRFYPVAPHAGAWIETSSTTPLTGFLPSPPMRGRGSKRGLRSGGASPE